MDLLLTDLSPNRTGMHDMDEARQTDMIEQALLLARRHLRDGGTFLTKVHELNRTERSVQSRTPSSRAQRPTALSHRRWACMHVDNHISNFLGRS